MPITIELRGIEDTIAAVRNLDRKLKSGALGRKLAKGLASEALKTVKKLTPHAKARHDELSRRSGTGTPLWRRWRAIERSAARHTIRVVIENTALQDETRPIHGSSGLTLAEGMMMALEKGARPHIIQGNPLLAWNEKKTRRGFDERISDSLGRVETHRSTRRTTAFGRKLGGLQVNRFVKHPGHRGFRMVEEAYKHMLRTSSVFLLRTKMEIRNTWLLRSGSRSVGFGAGFPEGFEL